MRAFVTVGTVIALSLGMWGCDGSGYSSVTGNPTSPTPDGSGVVTINVVAINGAQSFSPNPATVPSGQMVVWHNVDHITHRVVLIMRPLFPKPGGTGIGIHVRACRSV